MSTITYIDRVNTAPLLNKLSAKLSGDCFIINFTSKPFMSVVIHRDWIKSHGSLRAYLEHTVKENAELEARFDMSLSNLTALYNRCLELLNKAA